MLDTPSISPADRGREPPLSPTPGGSSAGPVRSRPVAAIGVAGITVFAAALRLFRLGDWSFSGDEIFTLRDSLTMVWFRSSKPLLFFLNYHLVAPWTELNEVSLRVLPAAFGVAAVPTVFFFVRRTLGVRVGVLTAALVAIHPWHLYWSQFARYHTLVFLLTATFLFAFYVGLEEKKRIWVVVGLASALLAILAHPSAGLVLTGVGIGVAANFAMRQGTRPGSAPILVGAILVVIAVIVIFYLAPAFLAWEAKGASWGHGSLALLLSYADWLSLPLVCFAAGGLIWLWWDGPRRLATVLLAALGAPIVFLSLATRWAPVSTGYLFATSPIVLVGVAVFLDRLIDLGGKDTIYRLISATCAAVVVAALSPRIVSQYLDGGRLDFRAAARHVESHGHPGELVLSDQVGIMRHYLPIFPVEVLEPDTALIASAMRDAEPGARVWIVSAKERRGGFRETGLGSVETWVWTRCQLSSSHAVARLDFKNNEVRVFRCPGER